MAINCYNIAMTKRLIFALAAVLAIFTKADDSLTSIAAVNALDRRYPAKGFSVCLKGIVQGLVLRGFVVKDASGSAIVYNHARGSFHPGDQVNIRGYVQIDGFGEIRVMATNMVRLAHGPAPVVATVTPAEIETGRYNLSPVKVEGVVTKAFSDEIDREWSWFLVRSPHGQIVVSLSEAVSQEYLDNLIDATVSVTGICDLHNHGYRRFIGIRISAYDKSAVHVLKPAPANPFDAPSINVTTDLMWLPQNDFLHRQRLSGHVVAAWHGNELMLCTSEDYRLHVTLRDSCVLPPAGTPVTVVGFICKDAFHVKLTEALIRIDSGPAVTDPPSSCTVREVLFDDKGEYLIDPYFHGHTLCLKGHVRHVSTTRPDETYIGLEDGGYLVTVDIGSVPPPEVGSIVEVTGACLMDVESDDGGTKFGRIKGFSVILRSPEDIKIISRPPWWTPKRLLTVIVILLVLLAAIFAWNRVLKRIVERRSRALLKSEIAKIGAELRIDERTRLAVELHDSIAQNLTAISLQIAAAETAQKMDPTAADKHIETADRMLKSCRTELRRCLWDLRGEALEERDFAEAVRKTLRPVTGTAAMSVRVLVPRTRLSDSTAHAVLRILRELTSNAVRHGKAKHVYVAGELAEGLMRFSVRDDGCGFATDRCPGPDQGHFGLDGIRERIKRLGGTFTLESSPGDGTYARFEFGIAPSNEERPATT